MNKQKGQNQDTFSKQNASTKGQSTRAGDDIDVTARSTESDSTLKNSSDANVSQNTNKRQNR